MNVVVVMIEEPMPDPGYPRAGSGKLLFGIIFAENCMKMKKKDLRGRMCLVLPPRSVTGAYVTETNLQSFSKYANLTLPPIKIITQL